MFRRDLKLFFKCLTSALLSFAVLVVICIAAVVAIMYGGDDSNALPKVVVVDNEDSRLSNMIFSLASSMDMVLEIMEPEFMTEEEAMIELENGRCSAVVILHDGFTKDIMHGAEGHGTIIVPSALSAQADAVCEIAKFAETLLMAGQYGVFCGEEMIDEADLWGDYPDYTYDSNIMLFGEAVAGSADYFEIEVMDYSGTGMHTFPYYAMCWTIALLFLVALFFCGLFTEDLNRGMLTRLYSYGVGHAGFMCGKMVTTFVFRLVLALGAIFAIDVSGLSQINWAAIPFLLIAVAYITLIASALTVCFGDGITSHVLLSVCGLLLCGGIVQRQLLPHFILRIGDFTPFGGAKALISPMFGAPVDIPVMIAALLYSVIAVVAIYLKLRFTLEGRRAV
ncbi:MAG: ABC transporter permease [Ruminococcaceae bacterium]|nr:ABC transporter permease [Oscillospiraceae bacterium]